MDFLRLLRIVEDIMDIGCPVDKCREQETDIRNIHDPVTDTVVEGVLRIKITKEIFISNNEDKKYC